MTAYFALVYILVTVFYEKEKQMPWESQEEQKGIVEIDRCKAADSWAAACSFPHVSCLRGQEGPFALWRRGWCLGLIRGRSWDCGWMLPWRCRLRSVPQHHTLPRQTCFPLRYSRVRSNRGDDQPGTRGNCARGKRGWQGVVCLEQGIQLELGTFRFTWWILKLVILPPSPPSAPKYVYPAQHQGYCYPPS